MKKSRQEEIPRTILKYNTVNVDAGFLERGGKILFLNPACVVTAIGDVTDSLCTTPEFTLTLLPSDIAESVHEVKKILLQATFSADAKLKKNYPIPEWLRDFKKVEHLKLANADLDNLCEITDLPLQHLIFEDVRVNDADNLIAAIKQFKQLNYVVYSKSFPAYVVDAISKLNLGITLLTIGEYIDKGLW